MLYQIGCQNWDEIEYEPGWGVTHRPEGSTIFLNYGDYFDYKLSVKERNNRNLSSEESSDRYSVLVDANLLIDVANKPYKTKFLLPRQRKELIDKGSLVMKFNRSDYPFDKNKKNIEDILNEAGDEDLGNVERMAKEIFESFGGE